MCEMTARSRPARSPADFSPRLMSLRGTCRRPVGPRPGRIQAVVPPAVPSRRRTRRVGPDAGWIVEERSWPAPAGDRRVVAEGRRPRPTPARAAPGHPGAGRALRGQPHADPRGADRAGRDAASSTCCPTAGRSSGGSRSARSARSARSGAPWNARPCGRPAAGSTWPSCSPLPPRPARADAAASRRTRHGFIAEARALDSRLHDLIADVVRQRLPGQRDRPAEDPVPGLPRRRLGARRGPQRLPPARRGSPRAPRRSSRPCWPATPAGRPGHGPTHPLGGRVLEPGLARAIRLAEGYAHAPLRSRRGAAMIQPR